jgi:hypothetical protein
MNTSAATQLRSGTWDAAGGRVVGRQQRLDALPERIREESVDEAVPKRRSILIDVQEGSM